MTRIAPRTPVFAGQRAEGFYVDLGCHLRPRRSCGRSSRTTPPSAWRTPASGRWPAGVNSTAGVNVHSIAIQVPIDQLTANGSQPTSVTDPAAVIGVWTTASRQKVRHVREQPRRQLQCQGPSCRCRGSATRSFNEVIVPMATKDYWNSQPPAGDSQFASYVAHPELAGLLPVLYPGVFPNLAAYKSNGRAAGRPGGHPAHRDPHRGRPRVPELHGDDPGRHAAPQHGHPADHVGASQPRADRRRPGRIPERPAGVRRRGHDRGARHRRGHAPPGGPVVHSRTARPEPCPWASHRDRPTSRPGTRRSTSTSSPIWARRTPGSPPTSRRADRWNGLRARKRCSRPSGEGTVVLDIGGARGAAVIYVPAALHGGEIEIRAVGRPWNGAHTGIRERALRDGACVAAVFGALDEGDYQLRIRGAETDQVVELSVSGGGITEARWPER